LGSTQGLPRSAAVTIDCFSAAMSSALLGVVRVGVGLGDAGALAEVLGLATGGLSVDPPHPAPPAKITTAAHAVASFVRIVKPLSCP
jgi:hypothetical protein